MNAPFRDARLKIKRANKHIKDLEIAIRRLHKQNVRTVKENSETGLQDLEHTIPDLPNACLELSLIAGDAIHNLRTALDFAWVSLIERLQGEPRYLPIPGGRGHRNFPVKDTREELEIALNGIKVKTLCPSLFERIVDQIQPYERSQNGVIWTLHDLDISDKHMVMLELVPHTGVKGIVVKNRHGEIVRGTGMTAQGHGPYIISFHKEVKIKNKGKRTFHVTVKDAGIFKGLPILDLLCSFSQFVTYTVELLENI